MKQQLKKINGAIITFDEEEIIKDSNCKIDVKSLLQIASLTLTIYKSGVRPVGQ